MFIICRKVPGKSKSRILICQSVREGKKVIQKTVKYYGVAHNEEQRALLLDQANKELMNLKISLKKSSDEPYLKESVKDLCGGALLGHMVERFRVNEGFHNIFGPIFDELGLASLFTNIRYKQLKDVVIARVAEPSSKLHTAEFLKSAFLRPLSVSQIYRLMDELVELESEIKSKVFETTNKLNPSFLTKNPELKKTEKQKNNFDLTRYPDSILSHENYISKFRSSWISSWHV